MILYVYKFLGNKRNAREFFSYYTPREVHKHLRISSLEREQTRLINNRLKDGHTDRLFVFLHKTLDLKIFTLIEHKSRVRRKVFQQMRSQLDAAEDEYPQHPVIPILFYHGPKLPPKFRRFIMTAVKRLRLAERKIGHKEGRKEEKLSIARKMLQMGKAEDEVYEITGLTHEQLIEGGILFG